MADGGMQVLSGDDVALIRSAVRERMRLKHEALSLSDAKLARKFGVPRAEIAKLSHGVAWTRARRVVDFGPRAGTWCDKIMGILREGPATAAEISDTLHLSVHNVVAQMYGLEKRALVKSRSFVPTDNLTHKTVRLYMLPGHARKAAGATVS